MNLQQLRYVVAVQENGLNITAASRRLKMAQPGISRQIKLLEKELGLTLFERAGRSLTKVTSAGEEILARAQRILREMQGMQRASAGARIEGEGRLSIATTHGPARYVLPAIMGEFRVIHPKLRLQLHQGTAEQIANLVTRDRANLSMATGFHDLFPRLIRLPAYRWRKVVIVPQGHPLTKVARLTPRRLAAHPIITYGFKFSSDSSLPAAFARAGVPVDLALTADGADVIKTYVRIGLGVGVIAGIAFDPREDRDLVLLDATHLFAEHTAWIGFRRGVPLPDHARHFIELVAPQLHADFIRVAERASTQESLDRRIKRLQIPLRDHTSRH